MTEEQEFFDVRFICSTCHGEGKVPVRTRQGPGGKTYCRRCNGTGMFATGKGIKVLLDEINALKSRSNDEIDHITEIKEVITVRFNPVGVELVSNTGDFLIVTAGNNHLAVAVKPRGGQTVDEWEITRQKGKGKDDKN